MRIVSGTHKGLRLSPPNNITARPTTDFAKESLFNILVNRVDFEKLVALDLFAGTGGISYELASRGCPLVTAVEMNRRHADFIRKTCNALKLDAIHLIQGDVFKFVAACRTQFDLIFADPPYDLSALDSLPDLIFEKELLKPGGVFILEHPARKSFAEHPHFVEHRHYGNVNFSFFE
ncbi:MAG: RsmD family RNA methyltransferase [Prevotellaceae bacterium]|jgi:16S rRNA (guanine(966)-N(2))-methyltransferase RsmD|nr:RsmD family RNA methyltransferase [Prevotellaceae bacterium]